MSDTSVISPPNNPLRGRRRFDLALIVLFLIAICVPTAGRLTGIAAPFDPNFEKRMAAPMPQMLCRHYGPIPVPRKGSVLVFPSMFETYFGDQLGFRADLVRLYTQASAAGLVPPALLKASGGAAHGPVLVGRDGWLYMNGICIENYRNTRPFSEAELDTWITAIKQRRDYLARRNIEYLFFIAPDKATIYPEYLPRAINQVRPQSRLDQFLERMKQEGLATIDLRPALLAGKSQEQLYFRIDSHWNSWGGWIGYLELCRALQDRLPQMRALPREDFVFTREENRSGDLSLMIPSSMWRETSSVWADAKRPAQRTIVEVNHVLKDGVYSLGRRGQNYNGATGKAIVLQDSFFGGIEAFFFEHWHECLFVANAISFPTELIERERPTLVVDELVERKLLASPPVNPPELAAPPAHLQWAERLAPGLIR